MGLEYRKGNLYFYSKERVNGRVVSRYRGSGLTALAIGALSLERQRDRESKRQELREEQSKAKELCAVADAEWNQVETAFREFMEANGYRKYKAQWRKRREQRSEQIN